jgi:multidrug resistance protein MdtO
MAAADQALPAARSRTLDEASAWFWQFLKAELSPYPGRLWTVGRMTIAATVIMLLVMTFQIPYGFLAAINSLFLTRENPSATLRSAVRTVLMYALATAYTLVGIAMLGGEPVTHFSWIAISLFLAFYAIRVITEYFVAVGFGFLLAGAIPLWDQNLLNINTRTENTLWLLGVVVIASVVTVVVEYLFRQVHPASDLHVGITARLKLLQRLLGEIAENGRISDQVQKGISLYSNLGMSRTRRRVVRSGYSPEFMGEINAAIALLGRLMDLAASLQIVWGTRSLSVSASDRERCLALAAHLSDLEQDIQQDRAPRLVDVPAQAQPSEVPFLPEMERTGALITQVFAGRGLVPYLPISPASDEAPQPLFVADAFSNPEHLKFALRGTLATMLAYVTYQAVAWPGLSTSVATCIITALSTIGASRQKQFLRLGGVILGGVILGMGAQIFLLPHCSSIAPFTLIFAGVTAIAAWIQTATPRLSYLGVQAALAFYLIHLQEFTIQSSLAVARDRVVGTLLGLMCMWLVFDHLWVRDALQEMVDVFARSLHLLAELMQQPRAPDRKQAMGRISHLRDQINAGFVVVRAQSDALLFEFGPSRPRKLRIRSDFRRWQPALATLLQVQVTYAQYLLIVEVPEPARKAYLALQDDVIQVMRAMSDEVEGRACGSPPDLRESAATLRRQIENYFQSSGATVTTRAADVMTLTDNLASILAPLYQDVHATFVQWQQDVAQPHGELQGAQAPGT